MSLLSRMIAANSVAGGAEPLYVEDVFSTYLYTGNSSTQTITNGIDLAGEGGLVWTKARSSGSYGHSLIDTVRGLDKNLATHATDAQYTNTDRIVAVSPSGFSVGASLYHNQVNQPYVSWTFRRAPKFFDIVQYTGDGVVGRQIEHDLGVVPGMVVVKRLDSTSDWIVTHRGIFNGGNALKLNTIDSIIGDSSYWGAFPSDTVFTVGTNAATNANGAQYVAYLFAHDDSEDGIIQCGSATLDASGKGSVTLGWEPQFLLFKQSSGASNWTILDAARGFSVGSSGAIIHPNLLDSETGGGPWTAPNATGIYGVNAFLTGAPNATCIYLAIRRPNKPPTSGTEVYNAIARTGTGAAATVTGVGFAPDLVVIQARDTTTPAGQNLPNWFDRLRGGTQWLHSDSTAAEGAMTTSIVSAFGNEGVSLGSDENGIHINRSAETYINHFLRRAPGFMDIVCYTGTGVARTVPHGLGVVPELMIVKRRSFTGNWTVYSAALGPTQFLRLSTGAATANSTLWNDTEPTASVFTVGSASDVNASSGNTLVAYLFATLAGVSKVGSYTGTGTTLAIDCGFAAGARFVLIKRTDSTGDWYVWDTARGIIAGNDPYLLLNSTAAEVTGTDYIDPYSAGFEISSSAPAAINASGGTFIFWAIA